jgi:hypothetical protein
MQLLLLDMKGKDLSECYLKVHLPQSNAILSDILYSCSEGMSKGLKHCLSALPHQHPQLFMGVPERIGCTEENEFGNKKEQLQNLNRKEKELKPKIRLPYPTRQACMDEYYKIFLLSLNITMTYKKDLDLLLLLS